MSNLNIDTVKMVRKIRDKQADKFWRNPEEFMEELRSASQKFHALFTPKKSKYRSPAKT